MYRKPDDVEILCQIGGPQLHGSSLAELDVKLSLAELEDDTDVMDILYQFMKTSGLDVGTQEGAQAYELDEAVEWVKWPEEVDLAMSALTRHEALPC